MKILVISSIFPNGQDLTKGVFIKQQISELSKLCKLKVVAPVPYSLPVKMIKKWYKFSKVKQEEIIDNIEVYHPRYLVIPKIGRFLYGFCYYFGIYKTVKNIFKDFKFNIILTYFAYPDGFATALLSKICKKPFVIKTMGSDINVFTRNMIRRELTKYVLNKAYRVIAVSSDIKQKVVELGISPHKTTVIPNGINDSLFLRKDKLECRKGLSVPVDKSVILFIGNLKKDKGVIELINVFEKLVKSGDNSSILIIIGTGELKLKIINMIRKMKLTDQIILKGVVPHKEIPLWINACDVFCLPSYNEGCPNVILEALVCGKPVVGTEVGGIQEIVNSDNIGILVPPKNEELLSEAIQTALKRKWNTELICKIVEGMTWQRTANKILNELEMAVENSSN